jgi:hypothetical protein
VRAPRAPLGARRGLVAALAIAAVALLLAGYPLPAAVPPGGASSHGASAPDGSTSSLSRTVPVSSPPARGLYPLSTLPANLVPFGTDGRPALARPATAAQGAADPVTPGAEDLANPTLANQSYGTAVAAVGPGNNTILVGTEDESYYLSGSGLFWSYGLSASIRTDDGGSSWTIAWVGPNASWTSTSSPSWGDVSLGASSVAAGAGIALYATDYASLCAVLYPDGPCDNSSLGPAAPTGVAVARSPNGGSSWDAPQPIDSVAEWRYVSGTCPGASGPYAGYLPANISELPSVALSSDGAVAVVGWVTVDYIDTVVCIAGSAYEGIAAIDELAQVAVSTNGGGSWSTPQTIGGGVSGPVSVAVGPSPADTLALVYQDSQNGTSATFPYARSISTNLGATWTPPADLGSPTMVHPVESSAPDSFPVVTLPDLAADANASSPFAGNLYLAWDDNRTSVDGDPSVAFASGTLHGGFSGVSYLTPAGGNFVYFEPTVTVDPTGRVWVVYYAEDVLTGAYSLDGVFSTDGGATWSPAFAIADGPSYPIAGTFLGYTTGAAATASGLYAAWTDCRGTCESDGSTEVDAARAVAVEVTSSVAGPSVLVTSGGVASQAPTPFATAWDQNAPVLLSASAWTTLENSSLFIGEFANFTGAVATATNPVEFDYEGGTGVEANYRTARASWISGTVGPASVAPTLTIDNVSAPLAASGASDLFNVSVEPGLVYWVNASAPAYQNVTQLVPVASGRASLLAITLAPDPAWIDGRVEPVTATLTVDGAVVPVDSSTGLFNATVGWGLNWVNVTQVGLTSFSEQVYVQAGQVAEVDATLVGAWVAGSVAPFNATVTLDGVDVPVGTGGFNVTTTTGTHYLNATAWGYAPYHRVVHVTAGGGVYLPVELTDLGWVRGTVTPITAVVAVDGRLLAVVGGVYNVSEVGGSVYNVSVEAPGFVPQWANVPVVPATTHYANFSLAATRSTCVTDCGPSNGTTTGTGPAPPYSYTDAVVAAGLILGVAAVVAGVVLVRGRRPPSGDSAVEAPAPAAVSPPPGGGPS